MNCCHPVYPGVNRDVKMWFTYKLITWSHEVANLLFWSPSVVWPVVWQSSFHMVLLQRRTKFLWNCAPVWSAADVFGHCIRTPWLLANNLVWYRFKHHMHTSSLRIHSRSKWIIAANQFSQSMNVVNKHIDHSLFVSCTTTRRCRFFWNVFWGWRGLW